MNNSPPRKVPALYGAEISARSNELQREANELFSLYGRSADAPRSDESDEAYARRLLESAKRYSPEYNSVNFADSRALRADALPAFWKVIVAKGVETFKKSEGELRKAERTCPQTGRTITEFFGDEREAWLPFHNPPMPGRFNFAIGVGENAPGAVVAKKVIYSDGVVRDAR